MNYKKMKPNSLKNCVLSIKKPALNGFINMWIKTAAIKSFYSKYCIIKPKKLFKLSIILTYIVESFIIKTLTFDKNLSEFINYMFLKYIHGVLPLKFKL